MLAQTRNQEILAAYTLTIARLTPHEREALNADLRKYRLEGRLHYYVWNYWN